MAYQNNTLSKQKVQELFQVVWAPYEDARLRQAHRLDK